MLDIRTRHSDKKGTVVYLYVKHKIHNEKTGKIEYKFKLIGSFSIEAGYTQEILELLNDEEVLQLKNWLAENDFAKSLGFSLNEIESINLRIPQKLLNALSRLTQEGKRAGVEFTPHRAILENLLKTAKLVQGKIDKLNGFNSNILEDIGISSKIEERKVDFGDRALFKALLDLKQPIGKTCSELEEAALSVGRNKRIPPEQIKDWAGLMPGRSADKKVSDWCFYVAGAVLLKHSINPCEVIEPAHYAEYWSKIKRDELNLAQALKEFEALFEISKDHKTAVKIAIESIYKNSAGY